MNPLSYHERKACQCLTHLMCVGIFNQTAKIMSLFPISLAKGKNVKHYEETLVQYVHHNHKHKLKKPSMISFSLDISVIKSQRFLVIRGKDDIFLATLTGINKELLECKTFCQM